MRETERDPIEDAFAEGTPIDQAIEEGVQQALRLHQRAGNPIVVWQDGKMQWIAPEDIAGLEVSSPLYDEGK
jgi:hypothetical protein